MCTDPDEYATVRNHIVKRALDLGCSRLVPDDWVEQMEKDAAIDNWWEDALEKQISLKPHLEDCKFCRLATAANRRSNHVLPWMATPCDECGKARLAHRVQHPHIIDMGNGATPEKTLSRRDGDCRGFQEPNLSDIRSSLNRILNVTQ